MAPRRLPLALLMLVLAGLSACGSPYGPPTPGAEFGESVRQAIEAQRRPAAAQAPGTVPFSELEPALDRQHKARPAEPGTGNASQASPGLLGP